MSCLLPSWTIGRGDPDGAPGHRAESRQNGGLSDASRGTISRPPGLQSPAKRKAVQPEARQIAKRARPDRPFRDACKRSFASNLRYCTNGPPAPAKERFVARRPLPGSPSGPTGRLLGYARVSTEDQATDAQTDELRAAGCAAIYQEHGSGASRARPELARMMREIRPGDVLVVVRLDRLARSVSHLLEVIEP